MCKRNSPDKNEASTGCVRETPQIKRERERQKQKQKQNKKRKTTKKRDMYNVRETPPIKNKPARDV